MVRLPQPDRQQCLLNHQPDVLAHIGGSLVVDYLHVHVCLLRVVIVKLDVDVHGDSLPNVHDKVYRALNQISSHLL